MEPGASRTGSVLHFGSEQDLVSNAAGDAFSAEMAVRTIAETDSAMDDVAGADIHAIVIEDGVPEWRTLLAEADAETSPLPTLAIVEDAATASDAIAAGATDVFLRGSDDRTRLARRLENVLAAGAPPSVGATGGTTDTAEREFSDLLLDTIEDVFYLIAPNGDMLRWNDALASVTGYDDAEIARMNALSFFVDDHRDRIETAIQDVLDSGSTSVEAALETVDGERIPFDFTGARLTDPDGELRGIVGVGRDVTRVKVRERELELAETVFEEAQDSIFVVDVEGESEFHIERVNPAYARSTGLDAAEVEGMRPEGLLGDASDSSVEERYRECVEEQTPIEYEERLEIDGELRDWHTKLAPVVEDGEVVRLVGATRDVTERTELERELKEQANLLDHIFNQVPSALYVKDEQARFVRKRNYDDDPEEFVGKTDVEYFGDIEYARKTHADDLRVIEDGERIINKEEYNPLNDEWVLTSKVPWRDADGEIRGLIGVSRLITEKKEFERKLALRNRAMEEAPIGICIFDLDGDRQSVRYANSGFEELTGYNRNAIEGGDLELLTGPETEEAEIATLATAFDDGRAAAMVSILYRSDRTPFWGRISIAPVTDEDGTPTHFVGFLQDVTEEKEHEQTIERRLDEFGDVLAQQLRPPLVAARDELQTNGTDDDAVERAMRSIDRAYQLVEDLAAVNTFSVKSRDVSESLEEGSDR